MRILSRIIFICLLFVVLSSNCLAQISNSLVGPSQCLPVNGELATTQSFNAGHIALDGVGGFYVNCENNIYHVEKDGRLYWVAGTSTSGDSGDGGKAVSAQFSSPDGLALDTAGNLFIADTWNNRIRKVTPDGVITTVAGSGYRGYSGDGNQATLGLLDYQRSKAGVPNLASLFSITTALHHPKGVAVDSAGNIYIADYGNSRIRKVAPDGMITTVLGNAKFVYDGNGRLGALRTDSDSINPTSIAVDSAGNLYILDQVWKIHILGDQQWRVLKVTPDGRITTIA